jgi:polysaccharide biosynthesis protein PslF
MDARTPSPLAAARLIYIAPVPGASGVGDYASDFVEAVRPHVGEVVELRHPGPGGETLRDVLRHRRQLRRLLDDGRPTIVHAEQSGGALLPFWGPLGMPAHVSSATVHDPPYGVWYPVRVRGLARSKLLSHAVNLPLSAVSGPLERRVDADRHLFALSRLGADRLARIMRRSSVSATALFVPERPAMPPAADRPAAIGLFGYVYRGKGFEALAQLRAGLDPGVAIRVAGRGTQHLPPIEGVELVGPVEGAEEDAFFASIRVLVAPYARRSLYGRRVFPAASTVSRAIAYRTPVLALAEGALAELPQDGGAVVVDGTPADLAEVASALVRDRGALSRLAAEADALARRRAADRVIHDFLAAWESRW